MSIRVSKVVTRTYVLGVEDVKQAIHRHVMNLEGTDTVPRLAKWDVEIDETGKALLIIRLDDQHERVICS